MLPLVMALITDLIIAAAIFIIVIYTLRLFRFWIYGTKFSFKIIITKAHILLNVILMFSTSTILLHISDSEKLFAFKDFINEILGIFASMTFLGIIILIVCWVIALILGPIAIFLDFYVGKKVIPVKVTELRILMMIVLLVFVSKAWKYTSQPFVFENFSATHNAQKYFDEYYPIGTAVSKLLEDIEKSGGRCTLNVENHKTDFKYFMIYRCNYDNNFISLHPFGHFYIRIYTNEESHIVKNECLIQYDQLIP